MDLYCLYVRRLPLKPIQNGEQNGVSLIGMHIMNALTGHQARTDSLGSHYTWAMAQALLAVVLFSLTAPLTQMALGAFTPEFIAFMRAALSGMGSLMLAGYFEWQLPSKRHCIKLIIAGSAVTLIFPYTLSVSLAQYQASDLGILLAGLPLITALMAAVLFKEKQNKVFWGCIVIGTGLLLAFTIGQSSASIRFSSHWPVFAMLVSAGVGYSVGGQVAKSIGGFKTICWMTIFYLPLSLLGVGFESVKHTHSFTYSHIDAILALLYLCFISQWIGFHFWYGAMAKVGISAAGQVQLLQPFFTLMFSVPLLGAVLNAEQFLFAGLITCTVVVAMKYRGQS